MQTIDFSTPHPETRAALLRHPDGAREDAGPRILVVDDNSDILQLFDRILCGNGASSSGALDQLEASIWGEQPPAVAARPRFRVDLVSGGEDGCSRALEARRSGCRYAVAFVDMRMPGGWDGLRTIDALWHADPNVQVVICTAYSDHSWGEIAAKLGRSDRLLILRKPFETIEVFQIACALSEKWRLERERETRLEELERRVEERTRHLEQALNGQRRAEQELQRNAYYDSLTGLANRTLFYERLAEVVRTADPKRDGFAVCIFDIERFKTINDTFGRQAGDSLLRQVAERMTKTTGDAGRLGRIGADSFALVIPAVQTEDDAVRRLDHKHRVWFGTPFRVEEHELRISSKAGFALFPSDGTEGETLFANAEAALKKAKENGDRYLFYTQRMTEAVAENFRLESKLRQALENREFVLHYQPKVDLETRRIAGVEALIRWRSPELGLVPPMQFIPLMEETGLILDVGAWALRQAVLDQREWVDQGIAAPRIAVNVSAIQLRQRDFVSVVTEAISRGMTPQAIDLEITESLLMDDIEGNIEKLKAIRDLGVRIAIDDFGTGHSSLAYLVGLPVEALKIDRSFIITMLSNPDTMTLVRTIISLAHSLRLTVVAEGVDSEEQAWVLRLLRCNQMQGYLFSKPVPIDAMTALLKKG